LSHVIERAVLLNTQASISAAQLMLDSAGNSRQQVKLQSLEQAERQLIQQSMETAGGNVAEAAKSLEISRNALYRRLEKHNIDFSDSERDRDHGDHGD
jgi:DNA-binding NtrC family response regulator